MSKIFVPFSDGLLDYDCGECGAGCCQLGIIVANEDERKILLQEHPFIEFFSIREEKKRYSFLKYTRCWFLENSRSCEIQRKYGYSLKPIICRLHPFYVARCLDEFVVVASGCPMLSVIKRGGKTDISHALVLRNAQEAIDCDFVNEEISWSPERMGLERKVFEESSKFLSQENYVDFAAFQIAAATGNDEIPGIRTQLNATVNLWKSFLGIEDLEIENTALTYELTAITSLLRASDQHLRDMETHRIPVALSALYLWMILFSGSRRVKRFIATYEAALADIALGLTHLTEKDLRIKDQCLDNKLRYVRTLGQVYSPSFRKSAKAKGPHTGAAVV